MLRLKWKYCERKSKSALELLYNFFEIPSDLSHNVIILEYIFYTIYESDIFYIVIVPSILKK